MKRNGFRILAIACHAVLALCLVLLMQREEVQLSSKSKEAVNGETGDLLNSEASVSMPSLQDSLLTDSILSIVQSYYVDQDRVKTTQLLDNLLETLSRSDSINYGKNAQGGRFIEVQGIRYQLTQGGSEPSYSKLLEVIEEIAQIIDGSQAHTSIEAILGEDYTGLPSVLNLMLGSLDAHSSLLSPDAYLELRQGTEGSFGGLGVLVGIRDNILTVIKPIPRSPAMRIGIQRHDRILGINGVNTYGFSLDHLVEHMRGEPGTDVRLTMLRDGLPSPFDVNIVREIIQVDSVTTRNVTDGDHNILHLTIENFSSRTSREVLSAIKHAKAKAQGYLDGLVLDLRSNPGGLLDQAVQVADLFLQSGVIVSTKGRRQEVEAAGRGYDEVDFPIVVLVNGDSASASEIVAGALQDHNRAVVVGQPTFGKGSVQTIFELPGERALKLTIARYYTPKGRSIQNVGIIPDVWLQPLNPVDVNTNVLGEFRYKNERFLKNHLEANERNEDGFQSDVKAYHLVHASLDRDSLPEDRELEIATSIITSVRDLYGKDFPEGVRRAGHWLGVAQEKMRPRLNAWEKEARDWIAKNHNIDWSGAGHFAVQDPALSLQIKGLKDAYAPGEETILRYVVKNLGKSKVERLSIFGRSEGPGLETNEQLIGALAPGATYHGELKLTVPNGHATAHINLRVGLAVDAWPVRSPTEELVLTIRPRESAVLAVVVKLLDRDDGAVPGTLEKSEKTTLEVSITNQGLVAANAVDVMVMNLSGSQVILPKNQAAVGTIGPGETKQVTLRIEGSERLYRDELGLGITLSSKDLSRQHHDYVAIAGQPTVEANAVKNLMGH